MQSKSRIDQDVQLPRDAKQSKSNSLKAEGQPYPFGLSNVRERQIVSRSGL